MAPTTLYEVLGAQSSDGIKDIRKKFYRIALFTHPDKNPGQDAKQLETFKQANQAYQVLSDPQSRKKYDSMGKDAVISEDYGEEMAKEAYKEFTNELNPDDIGGDDEKILHLLNRWYRSDIMKMPIKERFELPEDANYCDLVDAFLEVGRLIHPWIVDEDYRRKPAQKRLYDTSKEAKIPQPYRDLLDKWNGDDVIEGAISNGNYLDENNEETKRPPKTSDKPLSLPADGTGEIYRQYAESFVEMCKSGDPGVIKKLNSELNSALKAEWEKTSNELASQPLDWNQISAGLENAKVERQKRDQTQKHTGKETRNKQTQANPAYGKLYSAVERAKNEFEVLARKYGFPENYVETYKTAIESYETTKSFIGSGFKIPSKNDATNDQDTQSSAPADEMSGVEFSSDKKKFKVYVASLDKEMEVLAWRPRGRGHQLFIQMDNGAEVPVYQMLPSLPWKEDFVELEKKGLPIISKLLGERKDLKDLRMNDFVFTGLVYQPRDAASMPAAGYAKRADMIALGYRKGADPQNFKAYWWGLMKDQWGSNTVDGKLAGFIKKAGLETPMPPTRNALAVKGRMLEISPPTNTGLGSTGGKHSAGMGGKTKETQYTLDQAPSDDPEVSEIADLLKEMKDLRAEVQRFREEKVTATVGGRG